MTEELQELEPLDGTETEPTGVAPPPPAAVPQLPAGLLPAPAYNPAADKQYFRFLFAGVVMFIGCLMPFGPDWDMAGYKTLGGAFSFWVAIGMVWSWWGAISTNRFRGANLKWVGLALLPLIFGIVNLVGAFNAPAVQDFMKAGLIPEGWGWGDFFGAFFDFRNQEAQQQADNFVRAYGSGKLVVFVGALLAEVFMLMAVFGGAKHAKAKKAAGAAPARARRR